MCNAETASLAFVRVHLGTGILCVGQLRDLLAKFMIKVTSIKHSIAKSAVGFYNGIEVYKRQPLKVQRKILEPLRTRLIASGKRVIFHETKSERFPPEFPEPGKPIHLKLELIFLPVMEKQETKPFPSETFLKSCQKLPGGHLDRNP